MSAAGLAWRHANAWWDLQFAAARNLWRLHSEASAAPDRPDYTAFVRRTQQDARDLFEQSASQMLANLRHAAQMLGAIQLRLARLAQAQADEAGIGIADGASMFGAVADAAVGAAVDGATTPSAPARTPRAPASRGAEKHTTAARKAATRTPRHETRSHAPARGHAHASGKTPRRGARTTH